MKWNQFSNHQSRTNINLDSRTNRSIDAKKKYKNNKKTKNIKKINKKHEIKYTIISRNNKQNQNKWKMRESGENYAKYVPSSITAVAVNTSILV